MVVRAEAVEVVGVAEVGMRVEEVEAIKTGALIYVLKKH
jgi:hypothetical protein